MLYKSFKQIFISLECENYWRIHVGASPFYHSLATRVGAL
ncbi:hypothetical protein M20_1467 [Lactococcus lactis subsp. lactis]|uniref:Uncharacterized protein n=1 Tax=Lactococcus lactis subsp. lactis TaxID=1360 RepID=A0A0V8E522_LACLL|nr:hypothetical protein M20_1467 [Lactococcus lactis subsp. lactis]